MGFCTSQMPQAVIIELTKQEHDLNKDIRCKSGH